MSTISNLIFYKIDNKTCNIIERSQGFGIILNPILTTFFNQIVFILFVLWIDFLLDYFKDLE